jgi:lipopolysaccharide biosynthesis glycosyltransferase
MKIYVGWDSREDIAFQVARHSILKRTKSDVEVVPIKQYELRTAGIYNRPIDKKASTEFSLTRFAVPILNDYKGWAIFVDCDFLWLSDVKEIFDMADDKYAVMCVHHDYKPKEEVKMDGKQQFVYPRKNWSSMMLWNCGHPSNKKLTKEVLNNETTPFLHRFRWLKDEEVGEIPYQYNYLEGWYKTNDAKVVHYTRGGPWFENGYIPDDIGLKSWNDVDYGKEWRQEEQEYIKTKFPAGN